MVLTTALSTLALAIVASATAVDMSPRQDMYWEVQAYSDDSCQNQVHSDYGTGTVQCRSFGATPVNSIKIKGHNVMFGTSENIAGTSCYGANGNTYPNEGLCQKIGGAKELGYWVYYQA